MRTVMAVGALCAMLLAGCGSSSPARSTASTSRITVPRSASATGVLSASTTTNPSTAAWTITKPRHFDEPTFVESFENGTVDVARLADGKVVQVLAPRPDPSVPRVAIRTPAGHLLVFECESGCGREPDAVYRPSWRDLTTGTSYPGQEVAASPDGTRVATLEEHANNPEIIRQYDAATGRMISALTMPDAKAFVFGFAWTPDSRSLVLAITPFSATAGAGGLYVVDRAATRLPARAEMANPRLPLGGYDTFASPAVLTNGHVVAFLSPYPQQRTFWPGRLVDVDLATGARRTVLGSGDANAPLCGAQSVAGATPRPCQLATENGKIEARGRQALVTVANDSPVWLYDGRRVRLVASAREVVEASW